MNLSLLAESDLGPTREALRRGSDAIFGTHAVRWERSGWTWELTGPSGVGRADKTPRRTAVMLAGLLAIGGAASACVVVSHLSGRVNGIWLTRIVDSQHHQRSAAAVTNSPLAI